MIPPAKRGGRSRYVNVREVLNAIFYVLSTGRQWKALPKDLPPKKARRTITSCCGTGTAGLSVLCVVASPHAIAAAEFIDQVRRRREGPQHCVDNLAAGERQNQQSHEQIKSSICHSNPQSVVDKILACEEVRITVYLPKPMTSGINAKRRFGKQTLRHTPALAVHAVGPNRSPKRKLKHQLDSRQRDRDLRNVGCSVFESIECSVTRCARSLSAACRIPTYDLAIQSDEIMTGYFRTFLIVAWQAQT
jgi:hypothetical protein